MDRIRTATKTIIACATLAAAQARVAQWIQSFEEFPVRQKPASFNLDEVMQKMTPKR